MLHVARYHYIYYSSLPFDDDVCIINIFQSVFMNFVNMGFGSKFGIEIEFEPEHRVWVGATNIM